MLVQRISLPLSNCYLVTGAQRILVDCGCAGDWQFLRSDLEERGVVLRKISAVVLTHAHFDHCGCAAFLQAEGVPVIASQHVQSSLTEGRQEGESVLSGAAKLPLVGKLLKTSTSFPPVKADVVVEESFDLSEFGIEGEIIATEGHTRGSLSVVLGNKSACVGDLVMGGWLGLPPAWKPHFHPLSQDNRAALEQMIVLRDSGIERFHVGHGDLLLASDVDRWINAELRRGKS